MYMPMLSSEGFFDDFMNDFCFRKEGKKHMNGFCPNNYTPSKHMMKTDIKENDKSYELDIDLPGFKKDDVKVEFDNGYMTILAEIKNEKEEKDENRNFLRRERFFGNCSRSFYVGDEIKVDDIKANFKDGVLHLNIPKVSEVKNEKKYITVED